MSSPDPIRPPAEPVAVAPPPSPVELWPLGGLALAITLLVLQTVLVSFTGWGLYSLTEEGRLLPPFMLVGACVYLLWAWLPLAGNVVWWARKRPRVILDRDGVHADHLRARWLEILEVRVHRPWGARAGAEVVVALTPEFVRRQSIRHRFGLSLRHMCGRRRLAIRLWGLAKPAAEVAAIVTRQRDAWLSHAFA